MDGADCLCPEPRDAAAVWLAAFGDALARRDAASAARSFLIYSKYLALQTKAREAGLAG